MTIPAVSVAMSVYNAEAYVGAALDSILAQDFTDFELLVIDDRSTDGTSAEIALRAARDPRVRVLPSPAKGRVPALNALFAAARAPWVAIADGDDISLPHRLAVQMEWLARNPGHVVLGAEVERMGPNGEPLDLPRTDRPRDHEGIIANLESGPQLSNNVCVISRDAAVAAGLYRPAYRHAEDYDLWLRLSTLGRMANLPDQLVRYRIHPGQVSTAHLVEQTANTAIAWLAHCERLAGRPDPTQGWESMPPLATLDTIFAPGARDYAYRKIIDRILFAPEVLAGDGWEALIGHIGTGAPQPRLWRATARLLRSGRPLHAARAAAALLRSAA